MFRFLEDDDNEIWLKLGQLSVVGGLLGAIPPREQQANLPPGANHCMLVPTIVLASVCWCLLVTWCPLVLPSACWCLLWCQYSWFLLGLVQWVLHSLWYKLPQSLV